MTLVSRLLGFVRDMAIAQAFGATAATDAFFVAFKIPNFLRRLFAEGAFAQAFVPALSECRQNNGHAELKAFIDGTAGALASLLLALTAIGMAAAPWVILLFAPGFAQEGRQYDLAVQLLRVTFPYLFFISLTAFAGGILNIFGRFAVPAITPVILNLCMIAAALWLAPLSDEPMLALAWSVSVAGAAQLLFQAPALWRLGLLPRLRWGFGDAGVRRILGLIGPSLFGVSVTQINLLLNTVLASLLASGSVSWLYYSDRLLEFPVGLFGVALGTVVLPALSLNHSGGRAGAFSLALDWALRWVAAVGLPATVGLALLAEPILSVLFEYEEFTATDVRMAGQSLLAYSLGLVGFVAVKVLVPGYSARQDARSPVRYGVVAVAANIVLSFALAPWLAHAGLALATALAALLNSGLLLRKLLKDGVYQPAPGWGEFFGRMAVANAAMGLWLFRWADRGEWAGWDKAERAGHLLLWVVAGAGVYGLCLWLCGMRPRHLSLRGGEA
ncbi:putative lipid II flippase MurJ [Methylogaea oryzae]|uniref:Probable lipid II flippase MurJ n=2 Tax=Methylogaea oryzae TaxID=1295382 RepID=A0A8D4VR33_9GAMM|nr:putative lipid II flippase MurJ [Methylogaea oryzae]